MTFKKLKSANLGDEVYVVVKTLNLANKKVRLNVKQGKGEKTKLETKEKGLMLQHDKGTTTEAEAVVGAYAKDNKITNKTDFKDWAIFKIILGDKDTRREKEELDKLKDKKAFMYLLVDAHTPNDIKVVYNGRNPDKKGEPDKRTTPKYWLDMDDKWFELEKDERAPWMEIAYKELGVEEIAGEKHNSRILEYHKSAGVKDYKNKKGQTVKITDDKNWPWCSSFACWVFTQTPEYSGKITAKATNWKNWGNADSKDKPMYGALAVIDWGKNDNKAGHVGFIVKVDDKNFYLLGGNQTGGDKTTNGKVCIGKYKKSHIDYVRIPNNYKPTEKDYKYDEIKSTNEGFESLSSTR
ncbi:TIGR02594 family protein [Tenacibaculum sp. A30]|uniref:TIGR02594 family protein n=1 Tax=Tenacibaculum sp. A30 TaxID=3442644 RepID=UPI003EBB141E